MISVAAIGNTSWVCDLRLVSYALEQAERLMLEPRRLCTILPGPQCILLKILYGISEPHWDLIQWNLS